MEHLWPILVQFVLRLVFGVALAMGVTPPRLVTAGFYRVHLWVLMGLGTVAALAVYTNRTPPETWRGVLFLCILIAVASYVGSVVWLYERRPAGQVLIFVVALLAVCAAALATNFRPETSQLGAALALLDLLSSGLLLGATMSAMFLGHWYLNTPTMELVPLKRLLVLMVLAIGARTLLCAAGLGLHATAEPERLAWWLFVGLRWASGLIGTLTMACLAWQTLKIPNTQSATGILYAGVILAFIGELTAQLLSVEALYPL